MNQTQFDDRDQLQKDLNYYRARLQYEEDRNRKLENENAALKTEMENFKSSQFCGDISGNFSYLEVDKIGRLHGKRD